MKNIQHMPTNSTFNDRTQGSFHKNRAHKAIPNAGSLTDMYPIVLDDGRTIIYTSDKSKESEIRSRYALRKLS